MSINRHKCPVAHARKMAERFPLIALRNIRRKRFVMSSLIIDAIKPERKNKVDNYIV